jgi:putative ABC transport system permease protein
MWDALSFGAFTRPIARMVVRRLVTNPWITLFSTVGLALGLAIVILSSFMEDTIEYVLDNQFIKSQRQDLTLSFHDTCSESAMHEISQMDGVLAVEPFRAVPIRIRNGNHSRRLALMGLETHPDLFRVLDDRETSVSFPERSGLTITRKLAELLHVREGDNVEIEWLEGQDRVDLVPVSRTFPNYTSPAAYMNRHELHELLREGDRLSGAFVTVDPGKLTRIYGQIKNTPSISGVLDKRAAMKNFKAIVSQSTFWIRTINAIFAAFIAFGVTYNSALIAYTERARDLATMRVMGFSRRELATILLTEIGFMTAVAIPIGIPISYAFCYITALAIDTDSHRFPLVVDRETFAYGVVVLLISVVISSVAVVRLLNRIDMLSVLKVRE